MPHLANPLHLVIPLQPFLIVAKLYDVHGHQLDMNLVYLFLHSCIIYYLTYWLLDPKPQTTQTGDRNKFSPLDSPYAPYLIPAWIAALQAVNQSPANLIEATKSMQHYGHYIFPDPGPIQTYTKFCMIDRPIFAFSWPRLPVFNLQPTSQDFTRTAPVNTS